MNYDLFYKVREEAQSRLGKQDCEKELLSNYVSAGTYKAVLGCVLCRYLLATQIIYGCILLLLLSHGHRHRFMFILVGA